MSRPPIPTDESDMLAAEMALGVLEGEELARARALLAEDSRFRLAVSQWLGRFSPLVDEIEPVEPGEHVWTAIERRLGPATAANDNVETLRRRLNLWRGFAAGASALAASLALVMLTRAPEVAPPVVRQAPAPMVAMLGDEEKGATLVATWNPGENSLRVSAAAAIAIDADRSHELWVIPADGTPRSLGTLPSPAKSQIRVEPALSRELREGATLAVSVERAGGSPTGLPTGPVIASGKLERA